MAGLISRFTSGLLTEHTLGIDIGTRMVKIVHIISSYRSIDIGGFAAARIPDGASPEDVAPLVRDLIDKNGFKSDRVVLGLSSSKAYWRHLTFPFSKREKIGQVIEYELAPLVPAEPENLSIDFLVAKPRETDRHPVIAAAMPRGYLKRWLEALREQAIDPEIVDVDVVGSWLLSHYFTQPMPTSYLLLDWGWTSCNLLFISDKKLVDLRTVNIGLQDLASTLEDAEGSIDPQDIFSGIDLNPINYSSLDKDTARLTERCQEKVGQLARDIGLAIFSLQGKHPEITWEQVILAGGGASLNGLNAFLEMQFEIPVRNIHDVTVSIFPQDESFRQSAPLVAPAVGLALNGTRKHRGLNFRTEDMAYVREIGGKQHLVYGGSVTLIILLAWLAFLGLQTALNTSRLNEIQSQVETVFNRAVPEFEGSVRPSQYPSVLRARIMALSGGQDPRQVTGPAINMLLDISRNLSGDLDLTVNDLIIDNDSIRMTGVAQSFNTVDEAKKRLSEISGVSEVQIKGAKAASSGQGITFSLQLSRTLSPETESADG